MSDLSVILAALYLRGGDRPVELRRSAWPEVLRGLRREACRPGDAAEALRELGHWAEALVLETPGLVEWATRMVEGERVLSAADAGYPCRWLRVLGSGAPPVLWVSGSIPSRRSLSIVGSRQVPSSIFQFCQSTAREAVKLGYAVVSGRAEGCDRAAARGALSLGDALVEILPHGLDLVPFPSSGCLVSVCAPDEAFSAPAAMERNALIYASSSHTVVGHARFKEGGTWTGAMHAVRSRLSTLIVRRSPEIAMRSLAGLGGVWLDSPSGLATALKAPGLQRELFGSAAG